MLKQKNQMLLSSDICQYTYMYCIVYTSRGLFYFFLGGGDTLSYVFFIMLQKKLLSKYKC